MTLAIVRTCPWIAAVLSAVTLLHGCSDSNAAGSEETQSPGVSNQDLAATNAGQSADKPGPIACGSRGLSQCPKDQYCSYPESAQCGETDAPGVCADQPQACTKQYSPVCGCDAKTYGNACEAAASGVSVRSQGQCAAPAPTAEPCGGFAGVQCPEGKYCNYPEATQCGSGDQQGVCADIPEFCTEQYDPVCGCDAKTYGNACAAAAAGVSVAHDDECQTTEPDPATSCGGLTGAACPKGQFCNFPKAAQCGAADQTGTCKVIPEVCITLYDPVCGCDDKTYGNACDAAAAGVSVAHDGEC